MAPQFKLPWVKSNHTTEKHSYPMQKISKLAAGTVELQYLMFLSFSNLDSILKSRDITLPTKVHLVKAMVFPVVIYGCESWTGKKAER